VTKCPSKGDTKLSCKTNSVVTSCDFSPSNAYYDSNQDENRMGFFCFPIDEALDDKLKENAGLSTK
jgi:hypothetical protein